MPSTLTEADHHATTVLTQRIRVLAKRLEAGSFQLPPLETAENRVQIDGATFASLLAGIDFTASRKGWFRGLAKR